MRPLVHGLLILGLLIAGFIVPTTPACCDPASGFPASRHTSPCCDGGRAECCIEREPTPPMVLARADGMPDPFPVSDRGAPVAVTPESAALGAVAPAYASRWHPPGDAPPGLTRLQLSILRV